MAELKTKVNDASVKGFINNVDDEQKRKDCFKLIEIMQEITGEEAKMWGTSIVGFGTYHYKYPTGREGDFMTVGFSPRKQALTMYIMAGFSNYNELMDKLGKYKTGKSCLYVKKLEDIDEKVLRKLIKSSVKFIKDKYP